MQKSHDTRRQAEQQQQQGSNVGGEFKPLRLPAVAAAMHAVKPADQKASARPLPAFLQDENGGSD